MRTMLSVAALLILSAVTTAQTPVTTTGGTVTSLTKYSGSATIVPSIITDSNAVITVSGSGTQGIQIAPSTVGGYSQLIGGKFGAGGHMAIQANSVYDTANTGGMIFLGGSARGDARIGKVILNGNVPSALPSVAALMVDSNGNTGLGISLSANPAARLEVNGNILMTPGSGGTITFADGTVQKTAWNGTLSGGDYAESIDVSGPRQDYQPGDLLVIDTQHPGRFLKAATPYSTLIAGVYATKPGMTGHRQPVSFSNPEELPMAMMGIVPTKVCDENGPIQPGDLLVASSTPGYAMKGTDRDRLTGAVVGKALGGTHQNEEVIEVLITLQ